MKNEGLNYGMDFNEVLEKNIEKQGNLKKSEREIRSEVKSFFYNFSQKIRKQETEQKELDEEQVFLEEIKDLEENTAAILTVSYDIKDITLTKEELQQLDENDPGYVNDKVLDYDNDLNTKNNTYHETGLHTRAIRWGDYATEEGKEYEMLQTGMVLSRWGEENGTFMSDVNVEYDSLEMPIIKEKNHQSFYKVMKPFPVEISKIAKQPWNRKEEQSKRTDDFDKEEKSVIQYKVPVPVQNLIKEGYLKKLDSNIDI